jgi:outer membrane protein assembly factor BamB
VGADGTIYVAGQGNLYAIRPPASGGDGVLNWVFQTEGTEVSAPAIGADGTVYVTADDTLYAIQ